MFWRTNFTPVVLDIRVNWLIIKFKDNITQGTLISFFYILVMIIVKLTKNNYNIKILLL